MSTATNSIPSTDALTQELVALSEAASVRGDWNYAYHNSYSDDGKRIHYHSTWQPNTYLNNPVFFKIVEISSAVPVEEQTALMERLAHDHPRILHDLRSACLTAEFAMEFYYTATAVNEIRARKEAHAELAPLLADATFDQRKQKLFEVLQPAEYLVQKPDAPFLYSDNYTHLADAELEIMERTRKGRIGSEHQLVVAGSGPLPLTALLLHLRTGASVACVDRDYISARQQYELIHELERLGVVKPGAVTVINDNPATMDYHQYIGENKGLKKIPDHILLTYFAREWDNSHGWDYAVENAVPLSEGIVYPHWNMPIQDSLARAKEAGIPFANIRAASGTTQILYPPLEKEDLENTHPVCAFAPTNKYPDGFNDSNVDLLARPGVHNSSIAVTLDPIPATRNWGRRLKIPTTNRGFQGLITEEHFPKTPAEIEAFEKSHFATIFHAVKTP